MNAQAERHVLRGIEFHVYNDKQYRCTQVQQFDAILSATATDGAPLAGVKAAWRKIRGFNKTGVIPWVFVDPYDAEINHNGSIEVFATAAEADMQYCVSCQEI